MAASNAITNNAAYLLGLMTGEAGSDGTYSAPRAAACRRLGWSDATLGRALKELRGRGEITVVTPGGGAGRPTVYLLTRLARDQVARVGEGGASAGGGSVPNPTSSFAAGEQPNHRDHVLEGVEIPTIPPHVFDPDFRTLGRGVVDFTAGFAERAYQHWARLPTVGRTVALAPATCTAGWVIARRALGKERAYLGLIAGATFAVLGALAVPHPVPMSRSLPADPRPPVTEGAG